MQLTGLLLRLFVYSCKKLKEWSITAEPPLPKWSFLSPDVCSVSFFPKLCASYKSQKLADHELLPLNCKNNVSFDREGCGFQANGSCHSLKITKHTSGSRVPLTTWLTDWNWWFMQWGLSMLQRNIQFRSWRKSSTIDIHSEFWFKKCRIFQSHVLSIWSTYYSIAN